MHEYQRGGHIAAGGVVGYSNSGQKISKVTTEEKYENGRLVSKTVTTEYVYEQPQINITNTL